MASSVYQGIGGTFSNSGAGTIAFGTIAGGAGAALSGGNFWQGAVVGLVVSGLNHVAHMSDEDYESKDEIDPPVKMKPASSYDYSQEVIDGKFTDDWKYITKGSKGNFFTRAGEIFSRDWGQASTSDKIGVALAITPFRIIKFGTLLKYENIVLKGFTKHGLNRIIQRGITPKQIQNTLKYGEKSIQTVMNQKQLKIVYDETTLIIGLQGRNAGKIITGY